METSQLILIAQSVVATLLAVGGFFGIKEIISNWQKRRYATQDRRDERQVAQDAIHETNQTKQIESDDKQKDRQAARIDKLEAALALLQEAHTNKIIEIAEIKADLKVVQQALSSQTTEYDAMKAENKALKEDNVRLEKEITQLQDDNRSLRFELDQLKAIVTANGIKFEVAQHDDPLKVEIVKQAK